MPNTESQFKYYLNTQNLSYDIQNRYPPELTRLANEGYSFYSLDLNSTDFEINSLILDLIEKGGTSVIYGVGRGGETVPNGRNPKYFDSAELVIRVIKLYLLFIGKCTGRANDIHSIVSINQETQLLLKLLTTYKTQYNKLFWIFYNLRQPGSSVNYSTNNSRGINKIFYGVPGCGKSYKVKSIVDDILSDHFYERTIFYPDYSYTDFVGQIFPTKNGDSITYEFKPGVFTRILTRALQDPDHDYYLIIEEINRGNASSIFGDLFQLLDRDDNHESVYPITQPQIQDFLTANLPHYDQNDLIKIPKNLYIYATMNTSDQNVYVLDTAFKRRWEFELVRNDIENFENADSLFVPNTNITWKVFHRKINNKIVSNQSTFGNFDDKQIGPFFVNKDALSIVANDQDIDKIRKFAYKILEYLWDDVAKLYREEWFGNSTKTLEELIDLFEINGFNDFPGNLID